MLKKVLDRLKQLSVEPVPFDPSILDDPVATQAEWGPAKGGGASFGTHKVEAVDSFRLEFRPTGGALFFYGIFLVVGLLTFFGAGIAAMTAGVGLEGSARLGLLIPVIVGLVFSVVGGALMRRGSAPIVFDKRRGAYWRGRVAPHEMSNRHGHEHMAELEDVHALQLISELCTSKDSRYYSYELNLVLRDGRRMNVVDHGNHVSIREQADTLSAFLEVPVWDAT
ncbi:MAG: hypothetical protein AAF389_10165 [Gemmatimonadota bacterium]